MITNYRLFVFSNKGYLPRADVLLRTVENGEKFHSGNPVYRAPVASGSEPE
jgi:hypothetical protein